MNKITALILTVTSFSCMAAGTSVNGGVINFTGDVVSAACAVSPNSTSMSVNMGQVRIADFGSVAGTESASKTPFVIQLDDCDTTTSTTASVSFNGVVFPSNPNALAAGQGPGAATGVGIQIFDKSGKKVTFNSASDAVTLTDGTNYIPFQAGFVSTSDSPTPGNANTSAIFQVTYS